ncbi:MAG TPA: hypothetical protein VFF73_31010 [Planctomycetota bacterium]|nr:hypothetical protein [Planctomycetota bacterium]
MRTRVVLVLLLVGALASAGDEEVRAPFNAFAGAQPGDWELLEVGTGNSRRLERWEVKLVDGNKVVVGITLTSPAVSLERTFDASVAPLLSELYVEPPLPGTARDAREGSATKPLRGREFRCKKVAFTAGPADKRVSGVLWLTDKVKGPGIVERSLDGQATAAILGFGEKGTVLWGKTLEDAK